MFNRFDRSDLPDGQSAQDTLERYLEALRANPQPNYKEFMAIRGNGPENITVAMGALIAHSGRELRRSEPPAVQILHTGHRPYVHFSAQVSRLPHDNSLSVSIINQVMATSGTHAAPHILRHTSLDELTTTDSLGQIVTSSGKVVHSLQGGGVDGLVNFDLAHCDPEASFISPTSLDEQFLALGTIEPLWPASTENDPQTAARHMQGYGHVSTFLISHLLKVAG